MTDLSIFADAERFDFDCQPPDPARPRDWPPLMFKAGGEVDVPCFMRRIGPFIEAVFAVGNTSIVRGDAARSRPTTSATISVSPGAGWEVGWDCLRSMPDVFPTGREFYRRLVLFPKDQPQLKARAENIAQGTFSHNWAARQRAYGATAMPLPTLGTAQAAAIWNLDAQRLGMLRNALVNGTPIWIDDTQDGPVLLVGRGWRPHGPSDPGDVGGTGIYFHTGWRQNPNDLKLAVLMAECEHERMIRWCDRATGRIIDQSDYPTPTPDTWGLYKGLPELAPVRSSPDLLPPAYDFAHLIRGFRRSLQVALQADCPMAKRSVAGVAATERLRFSERGVPNTGGGYNPVNFRVLLDEATLHPGKGIWGSTFGRQIAWAVFASANDMLLSGERPGHRPFMHAYLEIARLAGMLGTGAFQKGRGGQFPSGLAPNGQPANYEQMFEGGIRSQAIASAARVLGEPLPACTLRWIDEVFGAGTQLARLSGGGTTGPVHFIATSDAGVGIYPNLTYGSGGGDAAHNLASIALAAHLDPTNRSAWVERGRLYGTAYSTVADKVAALTAPNATILDWDAAWLAQAQLAGV